ncbi:glutamyl-tRNA synthetase, mitochondrial [Verticillium alfalfae VaMs.102]|uniref:Glutamate--tRNA ligase, mitochondrial n=1 Tax=Verticillium alfalfae (strain VaMs.102 / ATCC MYA-4576 / FGSC 10136) TaxID=526221 RepID=C9SP19_VERA1|nr:glutamyl-tRNA synthetase, mitochondrial [Verticillium alfalfae VaMs.102]EEY20534.1 glutamyl-tRNA synthetase, mitochondrial [Verticillium alfalfae VaMs.102]
MTICNVVCSSGSFWEDELPLIDGGGLKTLRSKLQPKGSNILHELPKTPARTRFAPSPTGYLHLGSLRTALYNWLLARATGGQFLIRVEDTDQTRLVEDALPRLLKDLKWAELDWDEGPDIGGPFGPYVQSERLHHYTKHAERLIETGHAYRCFCTAEELERHKQQTLDGGSLVNYPGTCRSVPPDQAARRAANGESHVIRFRSEGRPSFTDVVYGRYQKNEDESDFILMKTDGYPTYHFANVVDDHLMEITHVIRGVEWLISTPKHIALYDAFKWTPPTFAHAGLLCGPNGEKLSKRNRTIDIDIGAYRDQGILPSALNNWLALLGWSPSKNASAKGDVFPSMDDLAKKFSLKFTKGNTQTNPEKLPILQRAHLTQLLRTAPACDARLTTTLIDPLLKSIQAIETPSTTLESPVPALAPSAPLASKQAYLLSLLKTLASDPKETAIDPQSLLANHPSLFFRPAGAEAVDGTLREAAASLTTALAPLATRDGEGRDGWTPDAIQQAIAALLANKPVEERTRVYECLRLLLTGDRTRPAKPAKLQLAVLGPEEAMLRLQGAGAA